jgi:hypothetical protein
MVFIVKLIIGCLIGRAVGQRAGDVLFPTPPKRPVR